MESRGQKIDKRAKGHPAPARRSCDQCRSRKIGCDRGTPCSNCTNARLNCTHSPIASSATAPKQRVLISSQYEQKIDDIARELGDIKLLLQGLNFARTPNVKLPVSQSTKGLDQDELMKPLISPQPISKVHRESSWEHSAHITDFVRAVLEDRGSRDNGPEASEILSSLRKIEQVLGDPAADRGLKFSSATSAEERQKPSMPPLEAVLAVLRWAKEHDKFTRVVWISHILPLQTFTEICQKVYFAVDEYSELDFLLTNGFLSYMFSEHVIISGLPDFRECCHLCQKNLQDALLRLPLLLPSSLEVVAALVFGAVHAIENSKATVAWKFISAASDTCLTLGYHRFRPKGGNSLQVAQERLFWNVYSMEKGLSLRLGRLSNIRDSEITLPFDPDELRSTKLGRINGLVYEQLYSLAGLSRPDDERKNIADALATSVRALIDDTNAEISSPSTQSIRGESDHMRDIYLRCDLVCQFSLLALILRAIPTRQGSVTSVFQECIKVARDALDLHEQCIKDLRGSETEPFMITKYINWAILYCPFVPFSILFTRAIQVLDITDLARLDRFAVSLQPEVPTEVITHPFRLYKLLCQAARLYFNLDDFSQPIGSNIVSNRRGFGGDVDFSMPELDIDDALKAGNSNSDELYDWYNDSQQIVGLLSEDFIF